MNNDGEREKSFQFFQPKEKTIATLLWLSYGGALWLLSYFLVRGLGMDFSAIWKAMPVGWVFCLVMVLVRYYTGGWKEKGVVKRNG